MPDEPTIGSERQRLRLLAKWRALYLQELRQWFAEGIYLGKPRSKFSDKEVNLPLDLWDSTPDR